MQTEHNPSSLSARNVRHAFRRLVVVVAVCLPASAWAQTGSPAGIYVEVEAQAVFGASDFEVGYRPSDFDPSVGSPVDLDDGDGWGGAFTLGYAWQNGWKAAVRYRRLDADDSGGPISPGLIAFLPGVPLAPDVPSGVPFPFADVHTNVDSETTFVDFEVGKNVAFAGGQLHLFGGLTYASIQRDVALIDHTCGCPPLALLMANDFHGLGPKIGVRGSVPLSGGVSLVGGTSVALLFGTTTFASQLNDSSLPSKFKAKDDRAVAAINGEAGLAFAIGPGALTVGYRIDAMLDALDTDQRVSDMFGEVGFPQIGDKDTDFVAHGPFARFAISLARLAD